jgi:hypothetical protein
MGDLGSLLVLKDFLTLMTLRDLCRLDTVVSGGDRPEFLECLTNCTFDGSSDQYDVLNKFAILWIIARDVSVLHMLCYWNDFKTFSESFEQKRSINKPTLGRSWLSLGLIGRSNADQIYVNEYTILETLLRSCGNVTSLRLVNVNVYGMPNSRTLVNYLPSIVSLDLVDQFAPDAQLLIWMDTLEYLGHITIQWTGSNIGGRALESELIQGIWASDPSCIIRRKLTGEKYPKVEKEWSRWRAVFAEADTEGAAEFVIISKASVISIF